MPYASETSPSRDVSRLTCLQQHDSPQQHLLSISLTLVLLRKSWHKEHDLGNDLHLSTGKSSRSPMNLLGFWLMYQQSAGIHPPTRSRLCWKEPLPIFNASAMSSARYDNFTKVQEVVQWFRDPVILPIIQYDRMGFPISRWFDAIVPSVYRGVVRKWSSQRTAHAATL